MNFILNLMMIQSSSAAIIGDCVGSFNEFNTGKKIRRINIETLKAEKNSFDHDYGYFTDDTTCALITMNNYQDGKFDIAGIKRDIRRWVNRGAFSSTGECFDIGTSTYNAIMRDKPITDASKGCGNGALMRFYPVAFATYGKSKEEIESVVRELTEITHPIEFVVEYSLLYVRIMHRIIDGASKEQLQNEFGLFFDNADCKPTGYVKDSLTIAWRTFMLFDKKQNGIFYIANLGYDSDTVASIYGSMIGAYSVLHHSGDFDPWLHENIKRPDLINSISDKFMEQVLGINNEQSSESKIAP
ncbi:ADP-ribosylglycohydrolase family protein [Aeromonas phage phiWae14]|nr:ADP-ribosylglycohydrolase family protein [Aeromonas phage phiWae14]